MLEMASTLRDLEERPIPADREPGTRFRPWAIALLGILAAVLLVLALASTVDTGKAASPTDAVTVSHEKPMLPVGEQPDPDQETEAVR
jgi:hypothetical protein